MGKKVGSRTLWKDLKLVVQPWIDGAISAITGVLSYSQPQTLTPTEQAQALSNMGISGTPLTSAASHRGAFANLTEISAIVSPVVGDTALATDNRTTYRWDGAAWVALAGTWTEVLSAIYPTNATSAIWIDKITERVGFGTFAGTHEATVNESFFMDGFSQPTARFTRKYGSNQMLIGEGQAGAFVNPNNFFEIITTSTAASARFTLEVMGDGATSSSLQVRTIFAWRLSVGVFTGTASSHGNAICDAAIGVDGGVTKIAVAMPASGTTNRVLWRLWSTDTAIDMKSVTAFVYSTYPAWVGAAPGSSLLLGSGAINAFGTVNASTINVGGSAAIGGSLSVGGSLAAVGPVTGASFTTPSDPMTKEDSAEFGDWTGELLDKLKFGTFAYNGQFGFTGHGAGVLDAGAFRDALPPALRDMYAPLVDHKDPDKKAEHEEKAANRRAEHETKLRERQEKRAEKRKRKEEEWAKRLEKASEEEKDAARLEIEQDDVALSMAESAEEDNDQEELAELEKEVADELAAVPMVQIGMVNNSMLLGIALAEIKSLRKRVDKLEKKNK